MSDGIRTGWHTGVELLGWFLGFLGPLLAAAAIVALLVWAAIGLSVEIPHQLAVHRLHRQARRSGRTT